MQLDGRLTFALGERYHDVRGGRATFREIALTEFVDVYASDTGVYVGRITESENAEGRFYQVTRHVTERSCSVIPPATPVKGNDLLNVVFIRRSAQPQIPIEFFGHLSFLAGPRNSLWPYRTVGPNVHRVNVTNDAGFIPFAQLTDAIAG